jgi:hypothetical protein
MQYKQVRALGRIPHLDTGSLGVWARGAVKKRARANYFKPLGIDQCFPARNAFHSSCIIAVASVSSFAYRVFLSEIAREREQASPGSDEHPQQTLNYLEVSSG